MFLCMEVLLPFIGTTLGAAGVFLWKSGWKAGMQRSMLGAAGGVMTAASVWSLLLPAQEFAAAMGRWSFLPAAGGFLAGGVFLFFMDQILPERSNTMWKLMAAVTIHNIPEGAAAGSVLAAALCSDNPADGAEAFLLIVGITIQNIPEGSIVSFPLCEAGRSRAKAFRMGALSGAVEPVAAVLTILLVEAVRPLLPWLLAFAAGTMVYVVVSELIPEYEKEGEQREGTVSFFLGFLLMMVLDMALG